MTLLLVEMEDNLERNLTLIVLRELVMKKN